jgi:hypothetical protein
VTGLHGINRKLKKKDKRKRRKTRKIFSLPISESCSTLSIQTSPPREHRKEKKRHMVSNKKGKEKRKKKGQKHSGWTPGWT